MQRTRRSLAGIHFAVSCLSLLVAAVASVACDGAPGPTYHQDIAPLYARACVTCHQEGGIGPFSLVTYDQARAAAELSATFVRSRLMPPTTIDASGACGTYRDARWLSEAEIVLVEAWAAAGAPEGTPPAQPLPPAAPDALDDANLVVEMAEPYTPAASEENPNDDYRCFFLDGPEADAFVTGYEIVPGQPQEVHHMLLFSLLTPEAEAAAQGFDDESPGPGWECFSTPISEQINLLAAWAPGTNVSRYPEGTGLEVPGGRRLVMQIHYNLLAGPPVPDVTALKLRLANTVTKHAGLAPIVETDLEVPPGEASAPFAFSIPLAVLSETLEVHGVFPHMHTLGRTLKFDLHPIGVDDPSENVCMVDVPRWDFNWQQLLFYEQPVNVSGSDVLEVKCTFDTSSRTEPVLWGEGTQEEMCLVFVYVTRQGGGPLTDLY